MEIMLADGKMELAKDVLVQNRHARPPVCLDLGRALSKEQVQEYHAGCSDYEEIKLEDGTSSRNGFLIK